MTAEEEEEEIHGSRRSMVPGSRRSLDSPKHASSHVLDVGDDQEAAAPGKTWRQRVPWYKPTEEEKRLKAEKKAQQVMSLLRPLATTWSVACLAWTVRL